MLLHRGRKLLFRSVWLTTSKPATNFGEAERVHTNLRGFNLEKSRAREAKEPARNNIEYHIEHELQLHFDYKKLMDFESELDDLLLEHELSTASDNTRRRTNAAIPHGYLSYRRMCLIQARSALLFDNRGVNAYERAMLYLLF